MTDPQMTLSPEAMDRLMPMHVWLTKTGEVRRVGPTLQKLRPETPMVGRRFLDIFEVRRPRRANSHKALLGLEGTPVHLVFHDAPMTALKGMVVKLNGGQDVLINLSFGISVVDAVAEYGLTLGDFAVTDLTVEMLYLVEAKAAVMNELRSLNNRLQGAKIVAEEQAFTDTLTGLKNRRAMDFLMARLIEASQPFSVMHLDLDFFKVVNDSFGHAAGDHVLQHVAQVLIDETRSEDIVVRFGGDEFVLIFDGLVDAARLNAIALRIIEQLEVPIPFNGETCRISASIGTALSTQYDVPDVEQMLHDADMALYTSKRTGRARVTMAHGAGQVTEPPEDIAFVQ